MSISKQLDPHGAVEAAEAIRVDPRRLETLAAAICRARTVTAADLAANGLSPTEVIAIRRKLVAGTVRSPHTHTYAHLHLYPFSHAHSQHTYTHADTHTRPHTYTSTYTHAHACTYTRVDEARTNAVKPVGDGHGCRIALTLHSNAHVIRHQLPHAHNHGLGRGTNHTNACNVRHCHSHYGDVASRHERLRRLPLHVVLPRPVLRVLEEAAAAARLQRRRRRRRRRPGLLVRRLQPPRRRVLPPGRTVTPCAARSLSSRARSRTRASTSRTPAP